MIHEGTSSEDTSSVVQENPSRNDRAKLAVQSAHAPLAADLDDQPGLATSIAVREAINSWLSKARSGRLKLGDGHKIPERCWADMSEWTDKVLPEAIRTEWQLGETAVSDRLVTAWIAESDVHRLAKLADQLIPFAIGAKPTLSVLKLMTTIAGILGIMRPQRARQLLDLVVPYCSAHPSLSDWVQQSQQWTNAGLLLVEPDRQHRVFWNNRLRNPGLEWSWETPEARQALSALSPTVATADPATQALFQAAVPNFWWDLFAQQAPNGKGHLAPQKKGTPFQSPTPHSWCGPFHQSESSAGGIQEKIAGGLSRTGNKLLLGLALGSLVGAGITFFWLQGNPRLWQHHDDQQQLVKSAESATAETTAESLPRNRAKGQPLPAGGAAQEPAATSNLPAWREDAIAAIQEEFPAIERLHRSLRTGNLTQTEGILRGGSSIAEMGSPSYRALMKWAILDPPNDSEVRRAVIRLFSLTLPTSESFELMEKLAVAGEPYCDEIRQMANLMLSAGAGSLTERARAQLRRITQSQ